jgi:biopolymer transport protein ExbD
MAEVSAEGGGKGKGKPKGKKSSTHIDMTPMVDLAFLLLTFFMLATTFSRPHALDIIMPDKPKADAKPPEINENDVLSLLVGPHNKLYYYIGNFKDPQLEQTDFSPKGIRKVLLETQQKVDASGSKSFMVLIKPSDKADYGDVVNLFDEMNITNMPRYALVDMNIIEKSKLDQKLAGQ